MRNKKVIIISVILIAVGSLISFIYFRIGNKKQIPNYVIENVRNNRELEADNSDNKKNSLEKALYKSLVILSKYLCKVNPKVSGVCNKKVRC